ncbi:MAG TPA: GNAT family N-acetyltransferase [Sphingomicrobium sp.]|nr:GNAT family N-acetyltransferase [Sphingomicrobium sp.]
MRRSGGVEKSEIQVRGAAAGDSGRIAQIYAHHVLHGTATYDLDPPGAEDMRSKVLHFAERGWPFLVAESEGAVVGFAYAAQFRERAAYAFACENSIYLDPGWTGRGVGRMLLDELCVRAEHAGFRQMIAVIGGAEPASVALHEACGFQTVGCLSAAGWKHGRWLDTVYMQRALGQGSGTAPESAASGDGGDAAGAR